jgi:hypothetical protein
MVPTKRETKHFGHRTGMMPNKYLMGIMSKINQAFKQNTQKYFGTTQFVAQLLQFP